MATTTLSNVEKYMVEEEGFYFAKVTMFKLDRRTGATTDIVETYEGFIKQEESGLIWMIRPEANMRSSFKQTVLTVSSRTISVEVGA
jgi:hypothetical protein